MTTSSKFEGRLEAAKDSYGEVLDATKHQDDKIGRFLTAIAFLFTGAIAFGTRSDLLQIDYQLGTKARPLPAMFLALFLALAVLSVLLLLIGLGPNLRLPLGETNEAPKSHLFFHSVAGMTLDEWEELWRYPHISGGVISQTYIRETHNLAVKTDFKYDRTNEARAIFSLALLFLLLAVALGFQALADPSFVPKNPRPWSYDSRWYVALITSTFAFVLSYDYFRYEQNLNSRFRRWDRLWPLYLPLLAAPTYVCVMLLASEYEGGRTWGPWALTLSILMGTLTMLSRSGWNPWPNRLLPWGLVLAVAAVFGWLSVRVLRSEDPQAGLASAIFVIVLLELPRLLRPTVTWRRRRRAAVDRGAVG